MRTANQNSKVWSAEEIRNNLETNNYWLVRGVLAIYKYQTMDEQQVKMTRHHNNVGFTIADSKFLSNIAEWLLTNRDLSEKQLYKTPGFVC